MHCHCNSNPLPLVSQAGDVYMVSLKRIYFNVLRIGWASNLTDNESVRRINAISAQASLVISPALVSITIMYNKGIINSLGILCAGAMAILINLHGCARIFDKSEFIDDPRVSHLNSTEIIRGDNYRIVDILSIFMLISANSAYLLFML